MEIFLLVSNFILNSSSLAPSNDIHSRLRTLKQIIEANFGVENVHAHEHHQLEIVVDNKRALVSLNEVKSTLISLLSPHAVLTFYSFEQKDGANWTVSCEDTALMKRVEKVLRHVDSALRPIPQPVPIADGEEV